MTSLRAIGVTVRFGGLTALSGVNLVVERGEILGLIGPNGAGKTTLVNVISGFQQPTDGRVLLGERDVTRLSPPQRAAHGVVRTFQGARLFAALTVMENVLVGALALGQSRMEALKFCWETLDRFGMAEEANRPASTLPYGKERRLDIARAVVTRPNFILLDEPAAGMTEAETAELGETIQALRHELNFGILLIEHDMNLVMNVCDEIQVLVKGEVLMRGDAFRVQSDSAVIAAYLGDEVLADHQDVAS
jgi:branched-chain amino acid transport system ATP-binding protein